MVDQEAIEVEGTPLFPPNSCLAWCNRPAIDISQEIDAKLVEVEADLIVTDKHRHAPLADAPVSRANTRAAVASRAAASTCTEEKLRITRARVLRMSGGKIACLPQLLSSGATTQCTGLKRVSLKWSGDRADVYHKWERDAATTPRPSDHKSTDQCVRSSTASGQHEKGGTGSAVLPPQNSTKESIMNDRSQLKKLQSARLSNPSPERKGSPHSSPPMRKRGGCPHSSPPMRERGGAWVEVHQRQHPTRPETCR